MTDYAAEHPASSSFGAAPQAPSIASSAAPKKSASNARFVQRSASKAERASNPGLYESKLFKDHRVTKKKKNNAALAREAARKERNKTERSARLNRVRDEKKSEEQLKTAEADLKLMASAHDENPELHDMEETLFFQIKAGKIRSDSIPDEYLPPRYAREHPKQRIEAIENCFVATRDMELETVVLIWILGLNRFQSFDDWWFQLRIFEAYYVALDRQDIELESWQQAHRDAIEEARDFPDEYESRMQFIALWYSEQQKDFPDWDIAYFSKTQTKRWKAKLDDLRENDYMDLEQDTQALGHDIQERMQSHGGKIQRMQFKNYATLEEVGRAKPELLTANARRNFEAVVEKDKMQASMAKLMISEKVFEAQEMREQRLNQAGATEKLADFLPQHKGGVVGIPSEAAVAAHASRGAATMLTDKAAKEIEETIGENGWRELAGKEMELTEKEEQMPEKEIEMTEIDSEIAL